MSINLGQLDQPPPRISCPTADPQRRAQQGRHQRQSEYQLVPRLPSHFSSTRHPRLKRATRSVTLDIGSEDLVAVFAETVVLAIVCPAWSVFGTVLWEIRYESFSNTAGLRTSAYACSSRASADPLDDERAKPKVWARSNEGLSIVIDSAHLTRSHRSTSWLAAPLEFHSFGTQSLGS